VYPRAKRPWLALLAMGFAVVGLTAAIVVPTVNPAATAVGATPPTRGTVTTTPSTPATSPVASPTATPSPATPGCVLSGEPGAPAQGTEWPEGHGDEECVGYSSTDALVFSNLYQYGSAEQQAQDARVFYDENQIFAENKKADDYAKLTGRTEVGLVYFAGLTEGAADLGEARRPRRLRELHERGQRLRAKAVRHRRRRGDPVYRRPRRTE